MAAKVKGRFIEPMLLLRTDGLPDGDAWLHELKVDGYRAIAFKTGGLVHLRSRNNHDFSRRYPGVVTGLAKLPDDTVLDGEVVALDEEGRPSFSALQNYGAGPGDRHPRRFRLQADGAREPVVFYVFDLLILAGRDVRRETLVSRRALLETKVLPKLVEPVRYLPPLDAPVRDLIASVKAHGLEGLVAKRRDSRYEPGLRSGAWMKMRVNKGQELVIGGYTRGTRTFDALIVGYYDGDRLIYAARTRNGFTPATRAQLFRKFKALEIAACPFANLPETKSGRWGQGLTAAKMTDCVWLTPALVAQIEFLEWTGDHHLRHTKFAGLREERNAREVKRE